MKRLRWLSMFVVLGLLLAFVGGVLANGGIEGVNDFTITPDTIRVGKTGQVYINANLTSGDGATRFCLYVSDTLAGILPDPIPFKYKSGFTWITVDFTQGASGDCPTEVGLTPYLYSASGLPTTDKTYSATFNVTIPTTTPWANYKLVFFPEEPSPGGMEFAEAPFVVVGPNAVALKNVAARNALPLGLVFTALVLGVVVLGLRRR